jgi:hypothetical protein
MNAEQKKRIAHEISNWKNACNCRAVQLTGDRMAALLQELVDAPEALPATNPSQISSSAEPFGYFKAEPFGWTDCAETDDGAIALYTAPPVSDAEPVAYFTGYNNGYPTIAPINPALCMAIGTALYSAPPAPSAPDKTSCLSTGGMTVWGDSVSIEKCNNFVHLASQAAGLKDELINTRAELADVARDIRLQVESEFSALLPGVTYMDEPDGGSPTVQEQIARMTMDAERYWWLTQDHPASEIRKLVDEIGYCLSVRGYGATSAAIDAAIEREILGTQP